MNKIIIFLLLLPHLSLQAQTTIFVNKNVQGGQQNGTNWANAFPDLQLALAAAANGDAIWVAAATYLPTATTDRSISFVLKQGVKIYGGFNGTETNLQQRNYEANTTILSGNIGNAFDSDNSYHVLYGSGIDSTTVLDGFTVTRGGSPSASSPDNRGGGLYLEPSLALYNTCPLIQHCRFEYNVASTGGAIFCHYAFGNIVNPILRNCLFAHNRASLSAGALYKSGPAAADRPFAVEDCIFLKNAALTLEGGGVYLNNAGNSTIFRRCIFEKDSTRFSSGAGIYHAGAATEAGSSLILDACSFIKNYAIEGAGLIFTDFEDGDFYCTIRSCHFEGNKAENSDGASFFLFSNESNIEIDVWNSIFSNNLLGTNYNIFISTGSNLKMRFADCIFLNNRDLQSPNSNTLTIGGGAGRKGDVSIENCLFADNGGGVAVVNIEKSRMVSHITNCTFYRNNRFIVNKSWYPSFDTSSIYGNDCYITNCIFWEPGSAGNQMFTNNDFMNVNMRNYHIDHSLVNINTFNIPGAAAALGDQVIYSKYPMFMDTANGDFRLLPCSPAVNKGNNVVVDTSGITTDLDGNPRIQRGTVDMGAYETPDTCLIISSYEPEGGLLQLRLSPNPARAGENISVQLVDEDGTNKIFWVATDALGRQLDRGAQERSSSGVFHITAPQTAGIYYLEVQGGRRSGYLKLIVSD